MRARLWPVLLALFALLAAQAATADPVGRYFYVSPMGGFTIFDSDFNWPGDHPLADKLTVGGRFGYQRGPLWALELAGEMTPTVEDVEGGKSISFLNSTARLVLSPWATPVGGPYFFIGGGAGRLSTDLTADSTSDAAHINQGLLEAGGGVRLWLTDAIGVRLEAREANWLRRETGDAPSANYLTLSGGLTFTVGAKGRDTDGDAVSDRRDKCPDTPRGATVDAKGCPIDTDDDAVFDGLDQCADTPKGCAVDAKGCTSDADGDSVCDGIDRCADTPAGLKVDEKGCVIELIERETELMDTGRIRLQNIQFDTGKAILKPESFQTLAVVGTLLTQWPQLKIEVAGHTDNVGGAASNRSLSLLRAKSVLSYMNSKYAALDSTRFTVKGYGKARPLVPNISDENKAQNRRVEFTVLNKEVLRKEVERRRLLKRGETAPADTRATP